VARALTANAGDIAIEVCAREKKPAPAIITQALRPPPFGNLSVYIASAAFVGIAAAIAIAVNQLLPLRNISLLFVLAVIAAAARYGVWAAAFAAVLSSLAINFFLTAPLYTFTIADPNDVWAIFLFLLVGIVVSAIAAHTRTLTLIARNQSAESAQLQAFARDIVGAEEETQIAASAAETASKMLGARIVVLAPILDGLDVIAETPGPEMLGVDDLAAAQWAYQNQQEAGHGSKSLYGARWLFVPVPGERGVTGVVGVRPFDDASRLEPEHRRLLDLIAAQAGVALERARFARDAANARVEAEGERQRRALIASLSHDLRTPLTTVRGAIESLLNWGDKHDDETRRSLLEDANAEAKKLSGFVQNLLDAMRLDAGAVHATRAMTDVADIVETAIDRSFPALEERRVARDIASGLPPISIDRALTERALVHVLVNAGKYSPPHSTILVRVRRENNDVAIDIVDEGPGFPQSVLSNLFGKFACGVEGDGRPPGTGLGLATAKGFIEAQGGSIAAANRSDREGAQVRIVLPIGEAR
jgi:two-component system sensor histidine kinase KdpD